MLIKAQSEGMITGGDEGKLHLVDNNLKHLRTTYIGACLHAGITHKGQVYVSVKNDSYRLQVFDLSSFRLINSFQIPFQVIKFIVVEYKRQEYILCALQNGGILMLSTNDCQIEQRLKLFIGLDQISDFIKTTKKNQYMYIADNQFGVCEIKFKNSVKVRFKLTLSNRYSFIDDSNLLGIKHIVKFLLSKTSRILSLRNLLILKEMFL
ncbi:UNKNOWN [Stylonychia lemnae]|uniref:Uncharacterized protein n=1 Tax=Stylonychia lemnae TaxID=5949 RepID=A0A078ACL2_STYLE|nr:UNKNOWN [Stylonychia lemnae]|eukprot:CDW78573.1 UNKNOWN [Stylonychia lemnae]